MVSKAPHSTTFATSNRSIMKIFKRSNMSRSNRPVGEDGIYKLAMGREWKSLLIELTLQNSHASCTRTSHKTLEALLRMCCRLQPPLNVVRSIHELNPQAVGQVDELGRFPVHIACCFGADAEVIEYLIDATCADAIAAQDKTGKTPLHLMCEYYGTGMDHHWEDSESICIVKMLYAKAPDIINIEDDEGQTAIEIAIESAVPIKVLKALQKSSSNDWKARRRGQPSHEEMQKEFKIQISSKRLLLGHDTVSSIDSAAEGISSIQIGDKDGHEAAMQTRILHNSSRDDFVGHVTAPHAA